MTLLVALTGTDGLALAADSRGTFGDPRGVTAQNDSQQKAHVLAPHVAVLLAGSGEVGSLVIQETATELGGQGVDGVTRVMEHLRAKARQRYNEWFPSVAPIQPPALAAQGQVATRPDIASIIGGYEKEPDGSIGPPKLYQIVSATDFSPMLHNYGFAVAGVAQYALYLLNRLYQPNRSVQELIALAVYVITETASQDGKVGGPVKVISIKPDTGCAVLGAEEVAHVVAQNEERSRALRDSFYQAESP